MTTTVKKRTTCTRDCPDACGIIATLEDQRIVRLQGDPNHPITQGFLCQRTSRFLERQYSTERLTKPLYRERREDAFQEISMDAALDLVAERMLKYRRESGPASILQYRCGGSLGIVKHVGDHFFSRFGPVTVKSGDVCAGAGEAAQLRDFGTFDSNDFFDLQHSKTIFLWGKNVFVSNVHLIPELKKARASGARIILIDPVHHQTTAIADVYIQPKPGTDSAIALGISRWLFDAGAYDHNAPEYCDHFEAFRDLAFTKTSEEWAAVAEISTEELQAIAKEYSAGPTCSMIGWGLQRRLYGASAVRTIDALAAISGNLGIPGGGASFYYVRRDAFDFSFEGSETAARTIPEPLLGPQILATQDPPIRMAFVWAANPVAMLPDSQTVAEALKTRDFTVVVDPFLTDTGKCANLVLPTTTFLEEDDLVGAYGHHYLGDVKPIVDPPANVLSDHDIFRQLATRSGLADEFDVDAKVWKTRLLNNIKNSGADMAEFERTGFIKNPFPPEILFANRKFNTPSGRVNLIHELPDAPETNHSMGLKVTAVSTRQAQASQWPSESQVGPAAVTVHPSAAPGHSDGDIATLRTHKSSMEVKLRFDSNQRPDVVLFEKGGWHSAGRSANALIDAQLTDDGECAAYYDTDATLS